MSDEVITDPTTDEADAAAEPVPVTDAADDILIAGYSIYDANAFALRQILGIWTSGLTYAERTAALQSSSFAFRLVSGQTLFDDEDVDYLTGSAGADWFFANSMGLVPEM